MTLPLLPSAYPSSHGIHFDSGDVSEVANNKQSDWSILFRSNLAVFLKTSSRLRKAVLDIINGDGEPVVPDRILQYEKGRIVDGPMREKDVEMILVRVLANVPVEMELRLGF